MNKKMINRCVEIDEMIAKLNKEKEEIKRMMDKDNTEEDEMFFKSIVGKSFFCPDFSDRMFLVMEYKGYDDSKKSYRLHCQHLYFSLGLVKWSEQIISFTNKEDFTNLYTVGDREVFTTRLNKAFKSILMDLELDPNKIDEI